MNKKTRLRNKCDKAWFERCFKLTCEVCGKQATQVHHFYSRQSYSHIRHLISNGISLCSGCHMGIHFRGDPSIIATIIAKRGKKWYDALTKKAREKPKASYQTIGYYEDILKKLKEI